MLTVVIFVWQEYVRFFFYTSCFDPFEIELLPLKWETIFKRKGRKKLSLAESSALPISYYVSFRTKNVLCLLPLGFPYEEQGYYYMRYDSWIQYYKIYIISLKYILYFLSPHLCSYNSHLLKSFLSSFLLGEILSFLKDTIQVISLQISSSSVSSPCPHQLSYH